MPPHVSAILRKLLRKKPEERYQTPAQLAAALSGEAPPPDPEPAPAPAVVPQPAPAPEAVMPTAITATPVAMPVPVPIAATIPIAPTNGVDVAVAGWPVSPLERLKQRKGILYAAGGVLGGCSSFTSS